LVFGAKEEGAPNSEAVGMRRVDWTRCIVEGKWPVWKVDFWRRRVPPIDLGSGVRVVSINGKLEGRTVTYGQGQIGGLGDSCLRLRR
jgi:hypothetical protein